MHWHHRTPFNVVKRNTFQVVFTREYDHSWYALPMQRATHDIIESMQVRWGTHEPYGYDIVYQWTPPDNRRVVLANSINFAPDSIPLSLQKDEFGSSEAQKGFSLNSLDLNGLNSSILYVSARPSTSQQTFTVIFDLIYLVTSLYWA
ncbi:hypothetical protein FRC02_005600 [Tulasnella sp. 418]|nr:hypothetical protein FRC02_005600 [Tulasnella sp. 418]